MFLSWSSELGGRVFGMGVWCSIIHYLGYSALVEIALNIISMGMASSTGNVLIIFLGRSPGTIEFGFLDDNIFLWI